MKGKPSKNKRSPLRPSGDINRVGCLESLGLGHLGRPETSTPERGASVRPGPATSQVDRPGIRAGRLVQPGRVQIAQGYVDLEYRPPGPEAIPLNERSELI